MLSFRLVETKFLSSVFLFTANFVLVEIIVQIKVKLFLTDHLCPSIGNHFLRVTPAGGSSFFGEMETVFLTNPSFRLVESEFLFIGNSILLFTVFTAFLSSCGNHYFLERLFPPGGKGKSLWKIEKKMFLIARKSVVHQQG